MKLKIDFNMYRRPENSMDWENAEKFYNANSMGVIKRLCQKAHRMKDSVYCEGSVVQIMNSGYMAHNIPIKILWFELIRLNEEEATFALTGVDYVANHYNPEPGKGSTACNNREK